MKLIYQTNERPPMKENLMFALQQIMAIMAATLLVPIIITSQGLPADPAAALFGAGAGTIFYILVTKKKSPIFLGSTFTFLSCYAATIGANYGYWGMLVGSVLAGLVYVIVAIIIKLVGSAWINKLLPAAIAGPIVAIIGLSLSGTATGWMAQNGNDAGPVSNWFILIGVVTFLAIVFCSVRGSKKMKLYPFVFGILIGYIFAIILTLIGKAVGNEVLGSIVNFQPFVDAFGTFTFKSIFDAPDFFIVQAFKTKGQYAPIDGNAIATLALIYVPVAIVELCQHTGDHKNMSNIIGRDLFKDPGIDKTLIGDGVGSMIGTIFGGALNTTYGESIGAVAISGCASAYTIITAGIGCMILSFFTPFVALINTIPKCVMGGACIAMYGFIAVSGLQLLANVDLSDNKNLYPVAVIFVIGIGGLTVSFGHNAATGGSLITFTSLAVALIVGTITRKICGKGKERENFVDAAIDGYKDAGLDDEEEK